MTQYILSLKDKTATSEIKAGGKGASLAWLHLQGFNVPEGFVVTPEAFFDFLQALGIEVLTQREAWVQRDVQHIQEMLTACRVPDELARPIVEAYHRLGGRVAVRSSMVGEDTEITSFAGQLDSVLNVKGEEELLRAIKKCWVSLFNWRLWSYLTQRESLSPETLLGSFSIAVVVQPMVDAQAAGVAFSADPMNGQPCVVIEAVEGLGDALVQGLAEPDRYIVDRRGVIVEAHHNNEGAPILADEQIVQLAALVRRIASLKKDPQDIEWALAGSEFHLLQSRPITSLMGRKVYSSTMVTDMLPGLIKPLVWSISSTSVLDGLFGRIFTQLMGPNDVDFKKLAKRIRSRVYADNTMLGELLERLGLPSNFFEVMSRDETAERHPRPPFNAKMLRTMFRLLRFIARYSRAAGEISTFIEKHDVDLDHFRRADWTSRDPTELLAQAKRLVDLYSETMWYNFFGPLNMMGRNRMLNRMVQKHAPDVAPSDLFRGLMGLKSLGSNKDLQTLAARAEALGDEIVHLLQDQNDAHIRAILSESQEGRAFLSEVDAFLDRYGFLSACGTDLSRTPWIENPTVIWQAIGRAATSPSRSDTEKSVREIREHAQARVRDNLNRAQRFFFDRLLNSTLTYVTLREKSSFLISEDSYQMRRIFLALSDQLTARGVLNQRRDIFFLTIEEIEQLLSGELEAEQARAWIAERRGAMEADAQIELPPTICGDHIPTQPIVLSKGQEFLSGIAGSSGLAKGYACIVLDPTEAPSTLTQDSILIVPFTDMSWTPLFSGIGGVVAETGGQLSHSAIVAREYGLPAVVNVKNATRLIENGRFIEVDGNSGRVYLK